MIILKVNGTKLVYNLETVNNPEKLEINNIIRNIVKSVLNVIKEK